MKKKKKITILGSSGFIGNNLLKHINSINSLICFDKKKISLNRKYKKKIYKIYRFDLSNKKMLDRALSETSILFHKANILGGPRSSEINYAQTYIKKNVEKLIFLLNRLKNHKIKKIIYDSSFQVFGEKNYKNKELVPKNYYGLTKLVSEKMLINWCQQNKVNLDILRYPRIIDESNNNFISKMIFDAYFKYKISINDEKKKFRIVHISDVVNSNLSSLKNINTGIRIFNIAIEKEYNLLEIAKLIKSKLKSKVKIVVKKNIGKTNFEPKKVYLEKSFFHMPKEFRVKINLKKIIDKKIFKITKNENQKYSF